eukprot:3359891-Pleurochrysis_carterae.AAC.1
MGRKGCGRGAGASEARLNGLSCISGRGEDNRGGVVNRFMDEDKQDGRKEEGSEGGQAKERRAEMGSECIRASAKSRPREEESIQREVLIVMNQRLQTLKRRLALSVTGALI